MGLALLDVAFDAASSEQIPHRVSQGGQTGLTKHDQEQLMSEEVVLLFFAAQEEDSTLRRWLHYLLACRL